MGRRKRPKVDVDRVVRETTEKRETIDREAQRLKQATTAAVATYELRRV